MVLKNCVDVFKKVGCLIGVTVLIALAGCNKSNDSANSDISSDYSKGNNTVVSENATSENNSENSEIENNSENTSVYENRKEEIQSNTLSDSPKTNTANSNNNTNSNKESATTTQSETRPVENKPNQSEYKTIQLEMVTTYYGYTGYFTLSQLRSDVHLTELGIGDNAKASICATEYTDIDTNKCLRFVFDGDVISGKDLMYNHVYPAGAGKTPVKVTYDLPIIKLNELTTYRGFTGYFSESGISSWDDPQLALLGTDDYSKVHAVITNYHAVDSEIDCIWFVYYNNTDTTIDTSDEGRVLVRVIK